MPARIEISDEAPIVHVEGADRIWALKSRLKIPLANITATHSASDEARKWLHGLRLGGTHVPGVISAGRFYFEGKLAFWDVHDPEKAIAIELADERYSRLVIEVEDPEAEMAKIQEALTLVAA